MSSAGRRIAVLASGEGTNLQALIDAVADGTVQGRICGVISDRPGARALERAHRAGIPAAHVRVAPSREPGYDTALCSALQELEPDVVVLAGYMRILSPQSVERFADRILNLHPSLLPRHKGTDTHRRVLAAGDATHGATVHFVTTELDGGPPVLQYRIQVTPADTPATLSARVHQGEYIILPKAVDWMCAGRLRLSNGSVMLDDEPLRGPVVIEEQS